MKFIDKAGLNMKTKFKLIMKTFFCVAITIPLLTACSNDVIEDSANTTHLEAKSNIHIDSQMTISKTKYNDNKTLFIQLEKGSYYEEWNSTLYNYDDYGTIYTGDFTISLKNEQGESIIETSLNKLFNNQDLSFSHSFQVAFDDYNNDGNLDFTIGQRFNSNGREFKLFTIKDNEFQILPIENNSMYISITTDNNSTQLIKDSETSFSIEFYDQESGTYKNNTYEWNEDKFITAE